MPKIMDGCLISCEKTICLFIQNLDKEHQNQNVKRMTTFNKALCEKHSEE